MRTRGGNPGRRRIAVCSLLLLASCTSLGEPTVVTIGSDKLTLTDLRREYANLPQPERPRLDEPEGRAALVDRVVRTRLLLGHGRALAAESPDVLRALEHEKRGILVRRLVTLEGGDPTPTSEEIEAAYAKLGQRRRIERAWFPDSASARAARSAVTRGASFEDAVASGGGVVPGVDEWVEWTPFPDPVADAALAVGVGEVSEPFEDGSRFALVRVLERGEQEAPPLEDARIRITRGLRVRAQMQRVDALARRLRAEAGLRIDDAAIQRLALRTREVVLEPDITEHDRDWAIPRLPASERDLVVAEWKGHEPWTAASYCDELAWTIPAQRPRLALPSEIRALCLQMVTSELFRREARHRSLEDDWWVEQAFRRAEQDRLVALAVERIEREFSLAPSFVDSVTTALREQQPSLFAGSPAARILRIELASREEGLRERERMAEAGGPVEWLDRLLAGEIRLAGTYHVTWLSPEGIDVPEVAERIFGEGTGAVAGPVEFGGRWMLIACLDLHPAHPLSGQEALDFVAQRILGGRDPGAVEQWLEAQRREVGVFVAEEALDGLAPGA